MGPKRATDEFSWESAVDALWDVVRARELAGDAIRARLPKRGEHRDWLSTKALPNIKKFGQELRLRLWNRRQSALELE